MNPALKNEPLKFHWNDKVNCWGWEGPKLNPNGGHGRSKMYPVFKARRDDGKLIYLSAVRFAWKLVFTTWPREGDWLVRTKEHCNDPLCVNPHHRTACDREDWYDTVSKANENASIRVQAQQIEKMRAELAQEYELQHGTPPTTLVPDPEPVKPAPKKVKPKSDEEFFDVPAKRVIH